jgi:hypothetical protein
MWNPGSEPVRPPPFGQDKPAKVDYEARVTESAARTGARRHVFLTLAVLALALKVLIPAGFMPGPAHGAPLVLCTGHGAVAIDAADLAGKKSPANKPAPNAPCAFAGHGAAAAPPDLTPVGVAIRPPEPILAQPLATAGLTPGRGLAAPPPPSRGPPSLQI